MRPTPQWRVGGAGSTSPRRVTSQVMDQGQPSRRPTTTGRTGGSGGGGSTSTATATASNYTVGLRSEYAELAGNCAAQHYEVTYVQCCRQKGRLVCRLLPQTGGVYDCPITGDAMREPVMLCDGHVYDREAIERWFTLGRQTSPLTNLPLASMGCMPLMPLRKAIETFLNRRPEVLSLREGEVRELQVMLDRVQMELDETREALALSRSMEVDLLRQLQEASRKVSAAIAAAAAAEASSREAACSCGCSSGPSKENEEAKAESKAISLLKTAMSKAGCDCKAAAGGDNKKAADLDESIPSLGEDVRSAVMEALAASKAAFDEEAQEFNRLTGIVEKLLGIEQQQQQQQQQEQQQQQRQQTAEKARPSPKSMLRRRSDPGAAATATAAVILSRSGVVGAARAASSMSPGKPGIGGKRPIMLGGSGNASTSVNSNTVTAASSSVPGSSRSPTLKTRGFAAMRRTADNRISPVRQQASAHAMVSHRNCAVPATPSPSPSPSPAPPSSLKLQRPIAAMNAMSAASALTNTSRASSSSAPETTAASSSSLVHGGSGPSSSSSSSSSSSREDEGPIQKKEGEEEKQEFEQRSTGSSSSSRSASSASASADASASDVTVPLMAPPRSGTLTLPPDQGYSQRDCRRASSASSSASTSCPPAAVMATTPVREVCPPASEEERSEIEEELFHHLTSRNGNDNLDEDGLKVFASLCGFVGTPTEWRAEYLAICNDYGSEPEVGLDLDQYRQFLRDRDGSAFCTMDDLEWLKTSLTDSCTETPHRCIWSLSGWDRWPVCKATCGADLKLRCATEGSIQSAASSGGA